MADKFKFSTSKLDKLPVPAQGTVEYADTDVNKLRVRVNSGGTKTFFLQKKVNGKTRHSIGVYPDIQPYRARELALEILDDLTRGIDPTAKKVDQVKKSATLQKVLDDYIKTHPSLKESTATDYRYKMKNGFGDWLHNPLRNITKDMVATRHEQLTDNKGGRTADNCMRVFKAICTYAEANEIIDSNPTAILKAARLFHKSNKRTRIINTHELPPWHKAVTELPNKKAITYLLTLLYMGFREGEARTLEWSQVNMVNWNITLYDTKNRSTKSFPIPTPLQPFYIELHKETGYSQWVYPNSNNDAPMSRPSKPMKSLDKKLGFHIAPHDCRRTFATLAESVNIPFSTIKRLMNHVAGDDITHQYIQTEDDTLRKASEKIANIIQSTIGRTGTVVPFNRTG